VLPSASAPPSGSGRWYLVGDLIEEVPPTQSAAARADQLLERHGVVTRDAVRNESVPGGFAGLYPVFAAMEEAGRVRRGYFIEGLGGSQFALPGAIDRLRASGDRSDVVVLAAADPASPFGASLPWPEAETGRPSRSAGAYVVLVAGTPTAFVERGARTIITFTDDEVMLRRTASAIGDLAQRRRPRMTVTKVDGRAAETTRLGEELVSAGFTPSYKGLIRR
jgi:ATP-dependent Lhr-like helicase